MGDRGEEKEKQKRLAFFAQLGIIDSEGNQMKLAKIAVPLSVLSLIGIILAMVIFNKTFSVSEEEQLGFALGYFFLINFTFWPMAIFIPFGFALVVCEICMLAKRDKYPALTGALVLMILLLPLVLFVSAYTLLALASYSAAFTSVMAVSFIIYLASFLTVCIAHAKERRAR